MVMRNTDATSIPTNAFLHPTNIFDLNNLPNPLPAGLTSLAGKFTYNGAGDSVFTGTPGADSMQGGTGDDTMRGNDGNDRVEGWLGNDNVVGGLGNDILTDTGGANLFTAGDGNDYMAGGGGDLPHARSHSEQTAREIDEEVRRIIDKLAPEAVVESLLVLDASQGQNGLRQAMAFASAAGLTGVVITKLDGSARGGVALAVASEARLPIRFIGAGEGIRDLRPFNSFEFVEALLSR
jgi:Ca2+-binding RTX toxin-like protein